MTAFSRRSFLTASAAGALTSSSIQGQPPASWYRRATRWGQTNITEKDPERYDIDRWRAQWKRTEVQGVIINAGGIVAYYPSKFPLHHRAEFLNGRDLYGELAKAAHADGLAVIARMDSNRTAEDFFKAHPDWFAVDAAGKPYRAADKYITCINSLYYDEYLPGILREIIERSQPEGFADNSWAGLGRESICYCRNCAEKFTKAAGRKLPDRHDWDDAGFRQWVRWNYDRRLEVWDLNNRVTKAAGGPDCLWIGMNSGAVSGQARTFRDLKRICERAPMMLMDHQARSEAGGFQENTETGLLIHGLMGWDKLMPESMAMYQNARTSFRLASKPSAEARMWMLAGIAGGIQPWWHHIGAYHEDRRMHDTAAPVMRWYKENEPYLVNRTPLANVGLVWSQDNTDFYGRDNPEELVDAPWRGMRAALLRARIPYRPVHADHIDRDSQGLAVLVLPHLAAMTDAQCGSVRRFVERGGGLVATGPTSLYTQDGDLRPDFALADLFGAHLSDTRPSGRQAAGASQHTYLRLPPEKEGRHEVLRGFEHTELLPYGGQLGPLQVAQGRTVPLTYVPPFPVYPPETAWMRTERTDWPGLVLGNVGQGGRVAYLPADLDRRLSREGLPDHARLLENVVRWAAQGRLPLEVQGRGLLDFTLFHQPRRAVLHVVNLTGTEGRGMIEDFLPVGPLQIRCKLPAGVTGQRAMLRVAGRSVPTSVRNNWVELSLPQVLDHEMVVVE